MPRLPQSPNVNSYAAPTEFRSAKWKVTRFYFHRDGIILVYIFKLSGTDIKSASISHKTFCIPVNQSWFGHLKRQAVIRLKIYELYAIHFKIHSHHVFPFSVSNSWHSKGTILNLRATCSFPAPRCWTFGQLIVRHFEYMLAACYLPHSC